jgi:IS30 family transposase
LKDFERFRICVCHFSKQYHRSNLLVLLLSRVLTFASLMPRGKELSYEERKSIHELFNAGVGISSIANQLKRSKSAISNALKRNIGDNVSRRKGRVAKISPQTKRQLLNLASEEKKSASKLVAELNLPIKKRRVQQILRAQQNEYSSSN